MSLNQYNLCKLKMNTTKFTSLLKFKLDILLNFNFITLNSECGNG